MAQVCGGRCSVLKMEGQRDYNGKSKIRNVGDDKDPCHVCVILAVLRSV